MQVQGQEEQPRVLLLSVPYALKAGDAQTLGGLPASAFVLAAPPSTAAAATPQAATATAVAAVSPATTSDVTTTGGTADTIPMFTGAATVLNSLLTQTGTTAINVGGKLNLPATGTATSSAGAGSQPLDFVASSYDSSTSAAVAQTFQWQAQAAGNDTSSPSATLNLLFGSGTSTPAQTGLNIASTGLITFAKGQTFPGVADLAAANTFTGNQTITGDLTVKYSGTGTGLFVDGPSAYYGFQATGAAVGALGSAAATGGDGVIGSATGGRGVYGIDNATSGASIGMYGQSNSSSGYGVSGTSPNVGVYGQGTGSGGIGVDGHGTVIGLKGIATASSGAGSGVLGVTSSTAGYGVQGDSPNVGVYGQGTGNGGIGVDGHGTVIGLKGIATASSGAVNGVLGETSSTSGYGVYGSSPFIGMFGKGTGSGGVGVDGEMVRRPAHLATVCLDQVRTSGLSDTRAEPG